jgi:hypothetical protein
VIHLGPTKETLLSVLNSCRTIQCATDFPHVEVLGVDLAPTSAMYVLPSPFLEHELIVNSVPPPNCRFEIDDLNLGLEHFFGPTFDIVHARKRIYPLVWVPSDQTRHLRASELGCQRLCRSCGSGVSLPTSGRTCYLCRIRFQNLG